MQNGKQCIHCCTGDREHIRLAKSSFYKSYNPKYKDRLLPICKACCKKESLDDTGKNIDLSRFQIMLHSNDLPFISKLYKAAVLQAKRKYGDEDGNAKGESVVGLYLSKLSSLQQYRNLTWADSIFDDEINSNIINNPTKQTEIAYIDDSRLFNNPNYPPQAVTAMKALYELLLSLYHISNEQQRYLLASYVDDRIATEIFAAVNDGAEFNDCRQFADHELIALKMLCGTDDDISFADCYKECCNVKDGEWPWTS